MKNVYLKIGLLIATLLGGSGGVMASDLPPCPSSGFKDNCFGTDNFSDDGDKYVGELRDGKFHGQGTYTYTDGSKEVGEWADNKLNGFAIQYDANGNIFREGIFENDEFLYAEKRSENTSSSSGNSKLDKHKEFCKEIGFTPGTEKFGDCIMKLMDKD